MRFLFMPYDFKITINHLRSLPIDSHTRSHLTPRPPLPRGEGEEKKVHAKETLSFLPSLMGEGAQSAGEVTAVIHVVPGAACRDK